MKLYLIRHGESETNKRKCWTGWLDVPLTEKGERDALFARRVLEGVRFDKVYVSDLSRARRTAEIALGDVEYETTPLLREIHLGSLSGMPNSTFTEQLQQRAINEGYAEFGGESTDDFAGRIMEFIKPLEDSGYETVAAFTHAGVLRGLLYEIIGARLLGKHVLCDNCMVAVFEYTGGVWRLHSWINP